MRALQYAKASFFRPSACFFGMGNICGGEVWKRIGGDRKRALLYEAPVVFHRLGSFFHESENATVSVPLGTV